MKKITSFLAFLLLVLGTSAQVQRKALVNTDSGSTAGRDNKISKDEPGKKVGRRSIYKELDLTTHQKRKMREIQLATKSKREAILNDGSLSDDQKKEKLKEIQKDGLNNLQQLLSDEQIEKLKALRKERRISNNSMDQ